VLRLNSRARLLEMFTGRGLHIYRGLQTRVHSVEESQMAFKENTRKYADEEEVSTMTLKKRRAFDDDNDDGGDSSSSLEEEVSFEEEPAR
jgi:hypothetical protein